MAESSTPEDTEEPMELDQEQGEVNQDQVEVQTDTAVVQVDIIWPDKDVPEKFQFVLQTALQTMFNKDLNIECDVYSVDVLDIHSVLMKMSPASVLSRLLEIKSTDLTLKKLNKMVRVFFSRPGSSLNSGDQKKMAVPASAPTYPRDSNPQDLGAIKKKPQHHQAVNGTLSSADYQSDVIRQGEVLKNHPDGNMAESRFTRGAQMMDEEQVKVPTDTAVVQVDISWPHADFPEGWSFILQSALQIMFNQDLQIRCDVHSVDVLDIPHSVMVTISPASVVSRLLEIKFTKLTLKKLNKMVRVFFSRPGSPLNSGDQKKIPMRASGLVSQDQGAIKKKPQHHQAGNGTLSSAGAIGNAQNAHWQSKEGSDEETHNAEYSKRPIQEDAMECRVPVCHYSHLSSAYRKEMDDIEEKFGVKFKDVVLVSIEANDQKKKELALQAFTELVQRCCLNFEIDTLPTANLEPDNLTKMLKEIQKDEEAKLKLSVSVQGYHLSGPSERVKEFLKRNLSTTAAGASRDKQAADDEEDKCPICLDKFTDKKKLGCSHVFCSSCLDGAVKSMGPQCPVCKEIFGLVVGDQPHGTMNHYVMHNTLPGFSKCDTIVINYRIPDGIQTEKHPNPGKRFSGTERQAYLPNNREGKEVLQLLKRAFKQKLIFTVGVSRTTGYSDTVIWNDIHHKTSQWGGPTSFGYPDDGYLLRVKEELKAKGIK